MSFTTDIENNNEREIDESFNNYQSLNNIHNNEAKEDNDSTGDADPINGKIEDHDAKEEDFLFLIPLSKHFI